MTKNSKRSRLGRVVRHPLPLGLILIGTTIGFAGLSVAAYRQAPPAPVTSSVKPVAPVKPHLQTNSTAPAVQAAPTPKVSPPVAKLAPTPAAAATTVAAAAPTPSSPVSTLVPTSPPPASDPAAPSAPQPSAAPSPAATPATISAAYSSTNWAGYMSTAGPFSAVSGGWVVPTPTSTSTTGNSLDAAWIGIGGVSSDDLIQTGTVDVVDPNGTITVSAFYELLPDSATFIPSISVSPGDAMFASIRETALDTWSVTITDQTDGQSFSTSLSYTSSHSSAEWIEEDPSYSDGSLAPFNNFGSVSFSSSMATNACGNTVVDSLSPASITLVAGRRNVPIATPSDLINGAFSVTHS